MYLVRISYPIFKSEWQEFNKPDRSGSPRFFTGAKADSGVTFNQKLRPCFSKNNRPFNLKSRLLRLSVISAPLSVPSFPMKDRESFTLQSGLLNFLQCFIRQN